MPQDLTSAQLALSKPEASRQGGTDRDPTLATCGRPNSSLS